MTFKNVGMLIGVALLIATFSGAPALARAVAPEYVSSEPEDGATVHEPPERVSATFSEPLDPSASDMVIHDECGNRIDDQDLQFNITEMSVGLAETPSGVYHVRYVASGVGGVTGTTKGSFEFTVHAGKSCGSGGGHHHGGDGGHEGGGHEGGGHEGGGHEGGHESGGHEPGEGHTDDHGTMGQHDARGHQASGHGGPGHEGHHGDKKDPGSGGVLARGADPDPRPPVAAPPTEPVASGAIALIAFVVAGGFGVLGGWLLRQIDRLSRP